MGRSKKLISYFFPNSYSSENYASFVIMKFIYYRNGHAFGSANDATTLKDMANGMGMGSSRGFLLFFNDRNVGAPKENGK